MSATMAPPVIVVNFKCTAEEARLLREMIFHAFKPYVEEIERLQARPLIFRATRSEARVVELEGSCASYRERVDFLTRELREANDRLERFVERHTGADL